MKTSVLLMGVGQRSFEMARNICSAIEKTVNPENFEKVHEGLRPLLVWLYQNNETRPTATSRIGQLPH